MAVHFLTRGIAAYAFLMAVPGALQAQTWTKLANAPSFAPGSEFLLTDGTILVQDIGKGGGAGDFWKLTPDSSGSYVNGTWSQMATLPAGYKPLYYGSAVLADGRVIINGGEYNGSGKGVWTTKGAIYDPLANSWTAVAPPAGWTTIGDAQSVVLPDGTYMLANCCTKDEATLDLATMTWTKTGTGKNDINDEEGWTLLPSGQVLTVDANDTSDPEHTEILMAGAWTNAGDTPVQLPDLNTTTNSHELGPQVLRPNGTVFAVGATGHTAVYSTTTKTWAAGPDFPVSSGTTYFDSADGPAALLPDGNVLVAASPGVFQTNTLFFEFDGKALNPVPTIPNGPSDSSYGLRLLVLPTGQVMETDGTSDVEIYTPAGTPALGTIPKIKFVPGKLVPGQSYTISGVGFNGVSQAVGYGDDYQAATNYPLVRITNHKTGHVFYGRTSNHSSMAVANKKVVTTTLTIPAGIEKGPSTLVVVANGVASAAKTVNVQ